VLCELDGTLWRKGTAAFRLLPFIDRDHPIIQELADMEGNDDPEPFVVDHDRSDRRLINLEESELSDSDTDSDADSAAHVSTDAESDPEEDYLDKLGINYAISDSRTPKYRQSSQMWKSRQYD